MPQMKYWYNILLVFCLLVGANSAWADVAREGEVDIKVQVMNHKSFPGIEFFVRYQGHYYDRGYHLGDPQDLILEAGKSFTTGSRGGSSLLYARDTSGNVYESATNIGGLAKESSRNVGHHLHQIQVLSVKDGLVKFKIVAKKKMTDEDKVIQIIKGDVAGGGKSIWMAILMPAACLLGLVAFFILRRRQISKNQF